MLIVEGVELLTLDDLADALGIPVAAAKSRASRRKVGARFDARTTIYTRADVAALQEPGRRGRPAADED